VSSVTRAHSGITASNTQWRANCVKKIYYFYQTLLQCDSWLFQTATGFACKTLCAIMTRPTIIFILSILFLSTSCRNNDPSKTNDGIGSFSFKSGHIAFTNFKDNIGSIYYTTNIESVAQQLTFPKTGWDLTIDLSRDLSKILYINCPYEYRSNCNICLYDLNLKKTDTLIKNTPILAGLCLSNDSKYIYYLEASEISNYSPIASEAPHGIDIYELSIETKKSRKLTDLKAYTIQGLTATFSDTIIGANMFDNDMGLIMVSTNTGKFKQLNINSPRNAVKQYFNPIDLRPDSIMYEAPYELYKHNLKTNKSELILRCPDDNQFGVIQPDDNWTNILFNGGDKIYYYNVPSKKLTEVEFKIK